MADLVLDIKILDLNVKKASSAFLRRCPMPQVPDPEDGQTYIDKYATNREWVKVWIVEKLLREINKGIESQAYDLSVKLTQDIFG
jgi:hypothetical protein